MADESPSSIPRWRTPTAAEAQGTKGQAKVVQDRVKAGEGLVKATKKETVRIEAETKKSSKHFREVDREQKKQFAALRKEFRRNQIEQGVSMADVAAEHIAGGGSVGGSVKAAVGVKVAQLKHKFDPLNIVKKVTGGSKLAVALAGKLTGRKTDTIRKFADLAPGEELPTGFGKSKGSLSEGSPSRMGGGGGGDQSETVGLLGQIASDVSKILGRLQQVAVDSHQSKQVVQEQLELDQKQVDSAKDTEQTSPSRMDRLKGKAKEVLKDPGKAFSGLMKGIMEFVSKFKVLFIGGIILAIGLLVTAGTMLYQQFDNLKLAFTDLKKSAVEMWDGVKQAFSDAGTWITKTATQFIDTIRNFFDNIIEYVQDVVFKLTKGVFGEKAKTPEEKKAELTEKAKGGDERSQRKLDKMAESERPEKAAGAAEKLSSGVTNTVPDADKAGAAEMIKSGSLNEDVVKSLGGKGDDQSGPITGSPQRVAAGSALQKLTAQTYKETYGVGVSQDTPENRAKRLPVIVKEAAPALTKSLAGAAIGGSPQSVPAATPTIQPVTPSPQSVPPPAPTTGSSMNQAAEEQKNAAAQPGGNSIVAPVTNVNHVNNNSQTVNQPMASPRSQESSYLRSQDRGLPAY